MGIQFSHDRKVRWFNRKIAAGNRLLLFSVLIMPLLVVFWVESMHRGVWPALLWMVSHPLETLLNYGIAFGIVNLLSFAFKGKGYFLLTLWLGLILSLLAYISRIKTDLRGEPLSLLDFRLFAEAAAVSEILDFKYYIPLIIAGAAWLLCSAFILFKVKAAAVRTIPFLITALLSGAVLIYAYFMDINVFYKLKVEVPASVVRNHEVNGFMLATLVDSKFLKVPVPENYGRQAIETIYREKLSETNVQKPAERPNVIFVLADSFWDLEASVDLQFNRQVQPFFQKLMKETLSGTMTVPGVGGGTANTEFEVLTGYSKRFVENYNIPYNPYNSYIHRPIQSLGHYFSEQGYNTAGYHSYHGWFYRRSEVYKYLGFDKFVSQEFFPTEPEKYGLFAKDRELFQLVLEEIAKTPQRDFISAITMETHGPYNNEPFSEKPVRLKSNLSEEAHTVVENYANLLHDTDKHLEELIQTLQTWEEPTLLVFYSDHIPPFGQEIYEELGVDIHSAKGRQVPFFIWSNYMDLNGRADLDANMLGAFVLDLLGMKDNVYMNYLYQYYEKTPHVDKKADEAMYRDFALLHYDMLHGEQYIQEFTGPLSPSESYEFGFPLQIRKAAAVEKKNMYFLQVSGEGFGWMSTLLLNGKETTAFHHGGGLMTVILPKDKTASNEQLSLQVEITDTQKKKIKTSNELTFTISDALKERHELTDQWTALPLDETLDWEYFASRKNIDIVRVNLELHPKQFYFVETDNLILTDENADRMSRPNESDIYLNGYLYLSIDKQQTGWNGKPEKEEMRRFFAEHRYILFTGNEDE